MRVSLLLTVLVGLVALLGLAFATKIGYNGDTTNAHQLASCKSVYEMCLAQNSITHASSLDTGDQRARN